MVHDEPEQPVEKSKLNLLINFVKLGLHEHHSLILLRLPNVCQVINALAVFICEQRWRLYV